MLLPNIDFNKGTTVRIEFDASVLSVISDLNDVRVVDENNLTEIDRICDGTSTSIDANCFFRMPFSMEGANPGRNSTYFVYYLNPAAGNPPDKNAARTTVFGSEDGERPFPTIDLGEESTEEALFGEKSYKSNSGGVINFENPVEQLRVDQNYVFSMKFTAGDSVVAIKSASDQVCLVIKSDNNLLVFAGGSINLGTVVASEWYKAQIRYEGGDCFYTIFDSNNLVFGTPIFGGSNDPGDIVSVSFFITAGGTNFVDNFYISPATDAIGLGATLLQTSGAIDVNIVAIDGFDATGVFPEFNPGVDGNLTIDFNVFNVDNNRMTVDINFSTSQSQGTGSVIINDLNLTSAVCPDLNWDVSPQLCSWDWNLSGVADANYFILMDLNAGDLAAFQQSAFKVTTNSMRIALPSLRLVFRDENTGFLLRGLDIVFNSESFTTDSSGVFNASVIDLTPGSFVVEASQDNNYSTRFFTFDINSTTEIDLNVFMLRDVNGEVVSFQFFDVDETTLLINKTIRLIRDENIASIRVTDASGLTSFFMEPDANYVFDIVDGDTITRFRKVFVTVNVPKREDNSANITPFDLEVSRIGRKSFSNQSAAVSFFLFSNTVKQYKLDVNASGFFTRSIEFALRGNRATASIQPFLVSTADGLSTKIVTQNIISNQPIGGVRVQIFKFISGSGNTLIESVVTDDTGEAFVSGLVNEDYDFVVTFEGREIGELDITFTSTQITILFNDRAVQPFLISAQPSVVFTPSSGKLLALNLNLIQTISIRDGEFSKIVIYATEINDANRGLDINRFSETFTTDIALGLTNIIGVQTDLTDWDVNRTLVVTVDVILSDGNMMQFRTTYLGSDASNIKDQVLELLKNLGVNELGCQEGRPCGLLIAISVLLTVVASAGVALTTGTRSPTAILGVSIIVLGLFTYFTWVPFYWFFLALLLMVVALIVEWRSE